MRIISYFENYNHKPNRMIEPVDKPIKKPDRKFKEVLNECRKNKRGTRNFICR